ncbi:MAG: lysostaphin resistance A-like protein [Stellaceae bacterium]
MKPRALAAVFIGSEGLRAGWGLLLFAAILVLLIGALFLTLPFSRSRELELFQTEAMLLVAVSGSTAIMAWVERRGLLSYGLSDPRGLSRVLWGSLWGVVLLTLLIGGLLAIGHVAIEGAPAARAVLYGLGYAAGLLIVALQEEMLLRGYLQVTLGRLVGFWPAAGLLSVAFGLMHWGNPGESLLGLLAAMLVGGVLCLALRLSGSLWWAIGFHAAWDWAQAFFWGTPVSGFVLEGRLMRSRPLGDPLWSGGATGPEGSLLVVPILALAVLVVVRSFARSNRATQSRGGVEPG